MKPWEREEARRLRREEGLSLKEICKWLNIAKSTASVWGRDIPLTAVQQAALHERMEACYAGRAAGAEAVRAKHQALRKQYQQAGRLKAREHDPLHLAGCMLYWAEGAKSRNSLSMVNSDPDMMVFYLRFLRECLNIKDEEIDLRITCYLGNGLSLDQIESYWIELLRLPRSCLRKSIINKQPRSSQQRGRKLLSGVCKLSVHRTRYAMHVLGAIQEYSGIDKPEWLM